MVVIQPRDLICQRFRIVGAVGKTDADPRLFEHLIVVGRISARHDLFLFDMELIA